MQRALALSYTIATGMPGKGAFDIFFCFFIECISRVLGSVPFRLPSVARAFSSNISFDAFVALFCLFWLYVCYKINLRWWCVHLTSSFSVNLIYFIQSIIPFIHSVFIPISDLSLFFGQRQFSNYENYQIFFSMIFSCFSSNTQIICLPIKMCDRRTRMRLNSLKLPLFLSMNSFNLSIHREIYESNWGIRKKKTPSFCDIKITFFSIVWLFVVRIFNFECRLSYRIKECRSGLFLWLYYVLMVYLTV